MLNMIISLAISALSAALMFKFVTTNLPIVVAVAVVCFFLPFILIVRIVMKKVEALMFAAQRDVQANRADKAIANLQKGFKYGSWQFYVKQQIFSQIGSIQYMKRDFNDAIPNLEKGFVRNWVSMAMLAIAYMKKIKPPRWLRPSRRRLPAAVKSR